MRTMATGWSTKLSRSCLPIVQGGVLALPPSESSGNQLREQWNAKMKKLIMFIAGCIALAPGLAVAATFTGEIMDEACADDGGHQAMFKKMGTTDPKQCTLACVKGGSKYVLFESGKTYYKLDDQKKPAAFAGQKVQVTGTLNKSSKTIHVTEIKAAS
jgi:hypothetical protein